MSDQTFLFKYSKYGTIKELKIYAETKKAALKKFSAIEPEINLKKIEIENLNSTQMRLI
jgi:hypothetical protein